jgi:SAM-dependent methyltransferase
MDVQTHWEKIYGEKAPNAVSWYRPHLETSLALIEQAAPGRSASVIDIGGGESTLVDDLLARGYENITVLDISQSAIDATRKRLWKAVERVHWLVADITQVELESSAYDVWHDRAVFHFLTGFGFPLSPHFSFSGRAGVAPTKNPCANKSLTAAGGVNIRHRLKVTNAVVTVGSLIAGPAGALAGLAYLVHTGGPYDDKNGSGLGMYKDRVDAGNISYGITCSFGAGFCQFAAGIAQTLAGNPDPNGTLRTGFDTPSDNASIRVGQVMRAAGCHE